MKMTKEHYNELSTLMMDYMSSRGLTKKDLLCLVPENVASTEVAASHELMFRSTTRTNLLHRMYDYMNDDHIATGLRKIWKELN